LVGGREPCGSHHGPGRVFGECRVGYDVGHEVRTDKLRGRGPPVAVENTIECHWPRATRNRQALQAHTGVLHRTPTTHLPVLAAAYRGGRKGAPSIGRLRIWMIRLLFLRRRRDVPMSSGRPTERGGGKFARGKLNFPWRQQEVCGLMVARGTSRCGGDRDGGRHFRRDAPAHQRHLPSSPSPGHRSAVPRTRRRRPWLLLAAAAVAGLQPQKERGRFSLRENV